MTLAEGWISIDEMTLVASQMNHIGKTGTILEVGAAAGRLFSFLQPQFPNWTYVAVDPWEDENVKLQIDWNKGYFDLDNLGELITHNMFKNNCPFAESHKVYFEDWNDTRKFDIISMGLVSKKVNWNLVYKKVQTMLTKDGVVIARNINHKTYGPQIKEAIDSLGNIKIDSVSSSAVFKIYYNNYGSHSIDLPVDEYKIESNNLLFTDNVKTTGRNNFNKFCPVPNTTKDTLVDYFTNIIGIKYDWNWEYFHSGEPAGLHTDYTSFPNSWKPKEAGTITHDCHIVLGVIIPLEWNCKQPYTINYNRISEIPRKLKFRKGEMRYQDTDEIFSYRKDFVYDEDVLIYNPRGSEYYKEYADLKVHSVYKWNIGTAMVFDTRRWHSSSWFLNATMLPELSTEYKRSIIGFASIDINRNADE
tara:strand:+ start:4926 stop:6176 length:1251 start_codon:yes stop_codon:yes gene_type:complete